MRKRTVPPIANVIGGFGPVVQMIGVLIHVEREDRRAAGERMAVVRGPLIDELAVTRTCP